MENWNVVATVRGDGFRDAVRMLEPFGRVGRTRFHNVLVADVPDPDEMLHRLDARLATSMPGAAGLASVVPVRRTFDFHTGAEFEEGVRAVLEDLAPALAGCTFHVRVHHRGVLGMSSREQERQLDEFLLDVLEGSGTPARVGFDDPDAVIAVEVVGHRCGIALFDKQDLRRYPILHLD